jgi:hypothetical protein
MERKLVNLYVEKMLARPMFLVFLLTTCLVACHSPNPVSVTPAAFREIQSPARLGSRVPAVHGTPGDGIVLNWLELSGNESASIRFSTWKNGTWSQTRIVIQDRPISRYADEAPGVVALSETNLVSFWSEHHKGVKKDEDQNLSYVSGSTDGGSHWTSPQLLNLPGAREASNISASRLDDHRAVVVWLDGRDWDKQKRFLLASAEVSAEGSVSKPVILDSDTCTCCPTAIVTLSSGDGIAAYRGHTPQQVRDIRMVTLTRSVWSPPTLIYPDQWHFPGCPVNGPVLDEVAGRVAAAWFTGAHGAPTVQLTYTQLGSRQFQTPVRVDSGNPSGRAQLIATPNGFVWVLWLENHDGSSHFLARRFALEGLAETPIELARGKSFAFPRAAHDSKIALLAWEEERSAGPLHVAELRFE